MNKQQKIAESPLKSYLVDAEVFVDGEFKKIKGVIKEEECKKYAKPNHRVCHGRGILNFDDGRVFTNNETNERYVVTKWRRTCDCVSRKLEKNPYLIG
jgi:hypothetical protein